MFHVGSLSHAPWVPISLHSSCEKCSDSNGCPTALMRNENIQGGLHACQRWCLDVAGCNALDFYNATNFCTLYPDGCNEPTASWDEASSYVLAQSCVLGNGTAGILIAGHCHIGIELPTIWNVVTMEVPELLCSPRSWACSLLVSFLYTYLRSPWLRMKMRPILNKGEGLVCPIAMRIAGSTWCKRITLMIGILIWLLYTESQWGLGSLPTKPADVLHEPLTETLWSVGSVLAVLLYLCKGCRSCVLAASTSVTGCIMSAFTSLAGAALSLCFGGTELLAGTGLAAATEATVLADGAVVAEGAGVVEGVAVAEGAIVADSAVVGTGVAEGGAAAEAAVVADVALMGEAATAAEVVAPFLLCAVQ